MILFIFLMYGFFFVLSVWLGFKYGLRMGQKSLTSGSQFWRSFFAGAAMIYAFHAVAAAGVQMLVALDGGFLVSFGVFILACAVVPVYAAVFWLPVYSYCFWDTRRTGLQAQTT